ncbi:MAG TPA: NAD(P)H-hydrate dehydratase [Gemmatimonadales bacterium]|nr:NAD(P)H-hydrate dehydratase [Gemmatimonadales bacterium]
MVPAIPILTSTDAAAWDQRAEREGTALETLMECAGRGSAAVLLDRYGHAARRGVLVAAGPGHNGGDGWVLARALHALGLPVWVTSGGESAPLTRKVAARARAAGVREVPPDGPWPQAGLVVDALLGTGATGAPKGAVAALLERLHDLPLPILAIDGPTGLDLGTGLMHGAPRADTTVTFGGLRRGHLLARDEVGAVVVVDIGHPHADPAWPRLVTDDHAAGWLVPFRARAHKGDRGRVVVVGGAPGMSGALRLACRAAFGAGAGLVFAVAPEESTALIAAAEPDVQVRPWAAGAPDAALVQAITAADAIVVGPGLGRAAETREALQALLASASPSAALVLDADALTLFAGDVAGLRTLIGGRPAVLTPHLGEFRSLFPAHAAVAEHDPWAAAQGAAREVGAVVLLKGVPSVIATPEGEAPWTIAAGNPGLATGGSGDLLAGFIGSFLAAGGGECPPPAAAALGAQVLGRAADLAARRSSARTLRPMDLLAALPDLWRAWELRAGARPSPRAPVLLELERPRGV